MDALQELRLRLAGSLKALSSDRDLETQAICSIRILVLQAHTGSTRQAALHQLLSGLVDCGRSPARARLQLAALALQAHGGSALGRQAPFVVRQLVLYAQEQRHAANGEEMCAVMSQLTACLLQRIERGAAEAHARQSVPFGRTAARGISSSATARSASRLLQVGLWSSSVDEPAPTAPAGGAEDSEPPPSLAWMMTEVVQPLAALAYRTPAKSSMQAACGMLHHVLLACQEAAVHGGPLLRPVMQTLAALALPHLLHLLSQGPLSLKVAAAFRPVQVCVQLLGVDVDGDAASRLLALCCAAAALPEDWRMREEAVRTLELLLRCAVEAQEDATGRRRRAAVPGRRCGDQGSGAAGAGRRKGGRTARDAWPSVSLTHRCWCFKRAGIRRQQPEEQRRQREGQRRQREGQREGQQEGQRQQ